MAPTRSRIPPKDASDYQLQLTREPMNKRPLTPEVSILINIFFNCTQSTNAALTRVCRTWSGLASDQLWSSLPSLLPLLRILLPLVLVDDELDFDPKAGRAPNWERFWALASRVRKLKHDDDETGEISESPTQLSGRISQNVIPYLLLHQSWTGRRFLLPKLETLEWSVYWEASPFQLCHFLSPALRDLTINVENEDVEVDSVTRNLKCLASLPFMNIERLRISTEYQTSDSDEPVSLVVASFVKSQLTLSQPTLSILDLSYLWMRGEVVHDLIQHGGLQSLELRLCCDTPLEFQSLLDLLARQCPRISTSTFRLTPSTFPELTPRHAIEPLLSCRLLRRLEIFHDGGLSVSRNDIKNMAQAWRNMEVLNLCASATSAIRLGTPLALLLDFAEEFSPRLRRLALHLLCGEPPTADVIRAPFPNLEVLGVGAAKAASTARAMAIGEFLANVCSEETRLAYTVDDWDDAFDTINWKDSSRASLWVEVAAIVESAQRLQKAASEKALRAKEFQRF